MSVCSTGRDMARWMRFQLTGLTPHGHRLLDMGTLHQLHRPHVRADTLYTSQIRRPNFPVSFELDGYAHGWYTGHYRGKYTSHRFSVMFTWAYSIIQLV